MSKNDIYTDPTVFADIDQVAINVNKKRTYALTVINAIILAHAQHPLHVDGSGETRTRCMTLTVCFYVLFSVFHLSASTPGVAVSLRVRIVMKRWREKTSRHSQTSSGC